MTWMKAVPFLTVLLIVDTIILGDMTRAMVWWHAKLFRIPGLAPNYISVHSHWMAVWQAHVTGMAVLCLALVVLVWRVRLWHPWLAIGVSLLWLYMVYSVFSHIA